MLLFEFRLALSFSIGSDVCQRYGSGLRGIWRDCMGSVVAPEVGQPVRMESAAVTEAACAAWRGLTAAVQVILAARMGSTAIPRVDLGGRMASVAVTPVGQAARTGFTAAAKVLRAGWTGSMAALRGVCPSQSPRKSPIFRLSHGSAPFGAGCRSHDCCGGRECRRIRTHHYQTHGQ